MKLNKIITISVLLFFSLTLVMCASSKPDSETQAKDQEKQKVDEILDKQKQQDEQKKQDEDDVLRLLGITPEKGKETAKPAVSDKQVMETKVDQLENQINEKDQEISELKTDLNQKDQKIKELESVLNDLKESKPAAPTTMSSTSGIASTGYKNRYENALAQYRSRNYNSAIHSFEELLNTDATNSYSDNCQYWIGECYYGLQMYQRAIVEFEKVFAFVNSNKEDDAQLKIGLCYKNLNQIANAKEALQRLIMKYPKSEYVSRAKTLLASM